MNKNTYFLLKLNQNVNLASFSENDIHKLVNGIFRYSFSYGTKMFSYFDPSDFNEIEVFYHDIEIITNLGVESVLIELSIKLIKAIKNSEPIMPIINEIENYGFRCGFINECH